MFAPRVTLWACKVMLLPRCFSISSKQRGFGFPPPSAGIPWPKVRRQPFALSGVSFLCCVIQFYFHEKYFFSGSIVWLKRLTKVPMPHLPRKVPVGRARSLLPLLCNHDRLPPAGVAVKINSMLVRGVLCQTTNTCASGQCCQLIRQLRHRGNLDTGRKKLPEVIGPGRGGSCPSRGGSPAGRTGGPTTSGLNKFGETPSARLTSKGSHRLAT